MNASVKFDISNFSSCHFHVMSNDDFLRFPSAMLFMSCFNSKNSAGLEPYFRNFVRRLDYAIFRIANAV